MIRLKIQRFWKDDYNFIIFKIWKKVNFDKFDNLIYELYILNVGHTLLLKAILHEHKFLRWKSFWKWHFFLTDACHLLLCFMSKWIEIFNLGHQINGKEVKEILEVQIMLLNHHLNIVKKEQSFFFGLYAPQSFELWRSDAW